jgi:hypothetical protein
MNHRTNQRKENPMKRPSKTGLGQFTLLLYREPAHQFDGPTKEKLLTVLAELLREALGKKTEATEKEKEQSDES